MLQISIPDKTNHTMKRAPFKFGTLMPQNAAQLGRSSPEMENCFSLVQGKGVQFMLNWCFVFGIIFAALPVYSANDIPMQIAGVVLDDPTPRNSLRITLSPYSEYYKLPRLTARSFTKELLGGSFAVDEPFNYFAAVDGNAAEVVLGIRDPNYAALRRKLSNLYGKAPTKLNAGEGPCADIEVTTWRGSGSTAVLAVIAPDAQSGRAVHARLHFRSNSIYATLRARERIAYEKHYQRYDPPECAHQSW